HVAMNLLQQNPKSANAYAALVEVAEIRAEWLQKQNKPFEDIVSDGLRNARKALELNPSLSEIQAITGKLHSMLSRNQEAIESLKKALAMNKNLEPKYQPLINQIQNQH
ncbi:MAG TPA: hypothetical protein VH815_03545, partial [Acidobacteriota bacterium]